MVDLMIVPILNAPEEIKKTIEDTRNNSLLKYSTKNESKLKHLSKEKQYSSHDMIQAYETNKKMNDSKLNKQRTILAFHSVHSPLKSSLLSKSFSNSSACSLGLTLV